VFGANKIVNDASIHDLRLEKETVGCFQELLLLLSNKGRMNLVHCGFKKRKGSSLWFLLIEKDFSERILKSYGVLGLMTDDFKDY
jgi:hypothetical protein